MATLAGVDAVGAPPAVVFDQVSVTIGGVRILEKVNAAVPRGSATAVIGPNGAGKTTLLMALLGQIGFGGRIHIEPTGGRASRIGYVPQRLDFDRGMPLTVLDLMVMGRQRRPLWIGLARRHRERALALLDAVKAEPLADRRLGALSGGELQRVLLALALEQDPDILILDEPSAGVDIGGENLLLRTARDAPHGQGVHPDHGDARPVARDGPRDPRHLPEPPRPGDRADP